jgi:SET domain
MNQALRPQPQLGEVLPGALTLGLFLLWVYDCYPDKLSYLWAPNTSSALLLIASASYLFASWVIGTLIDAIRNAIAEHVADRWSKEPLNWDFFVTGDREKVAQLDEYYFAYYQAKANYAIGLSIFFIYVIVCSVFYPMTRLVWIPSTGAAFLLVVCIFDAVSLRGEIKKLVRKTGATVIADGWLYAPAHAGVYTRLRQSSAHGIGVFAIRDIPEGTNVFETDTNEMHEIDRKDLKHLEPEIKRLYEDFCVWKGGKIFGPTNFNNLTVAWHLNHSATPNMQCDEEYNFISIRPITKGEELTVDYRTYDDRPIDFD